MIFLLGASGYVGGAFQRELIRRELPYEPISRANLDYSNYKVLVEALKTHRPDLVINCGGFTGKPNVDACETQHTETTKGNVDLARTVAQACDASGVRLGAVSSGCIYNGAKIQRDDGSFTIQEDLNAPEIDVLLTSRSPKVRGFEDDDMPNFTVKNNSSFYSGTKALAEEILLTFPSTYVWRLRMPFEERDHPRNYLSKLQTYPRLYQNWNSLSHLGDFISVCLDIFDAQLPGGAYTLTNPGYVSTREVAALIKQILHPTWEPRFWRDDKEFYQKAAIARRSNCILRPGKLEKYGIQLRDVQTALSDSLRNWKAAGAS